MPSAIFVIISSVFDFACGSGSLILNVRKQMGEYGVSKIFAQEKNITTYNLARMNMDGRDLLRRIKLPCFFPPACGKLSN
jgi:type I restriction-modification system DNA methylase subunit